ncbi:hypothetical protein EAF04_005594 [Stromatinia cepivora]|nr:hypothetical protein EAF04_005594 [Stromatinia cepivora]
MGLPIFFEPSVPDSPSKRTEKSTSRARSTIRRHPLRGNRPVYYARRGRAYLDNYERDTNSLEMFQTLYQQQSIRPSARVSITTSTRDAMREAMREHSLSAVPPSLSFERQSSRGVEADGPLMPAVPESRDYPNPPIGDLQGPPRILRTSVISISPYPETDTHSMSRTSGVLSPSEVDDRNMDPNTALAERVDGMDPQDSLSQRDHVERHLRRQVREREQAEREREERQRELNIRRREQSILDEEIREERRVERRLEERRLDESRDRQRIHNREVRRLNEFRERLRVDRERLQGDIERLRNDRERLQSDREQIEGSASSGSGERQQADTSLAGREQVERSDAPSTRERQRLEMLEQFDVEAYRREVMQSDMQPGLEEADSFIININYDGLGDRERSHDEFQEPEPAYRDFGGHEVVDNVEQLEQLDVEGHGSWDGLLITPDPQSPNPSSSFASTAASSSQRPSMSTSISSLHETEPLTNGDCDTILDSETEDEQTQQGLEWFRRPRTNGAHGRRVMNASSRPLMNPSES